MTFYHRILNVIKNLFTKTFCEKWV